MISFKPLASRSFLGILSILAPLIFAFAIALDIYVPSIPTIRDYFDVNVGTMQLTVSIYLLITGLVQLVMGPVSDQVGRRKVALFSAVLLIVGSIVCAVAFNITFLILGRIIQALGACGMMVSCFAIVRDLFSEDECARVYSFLNSTIALSPLLAPLVGGYLAYWFGWRMSFVFLAVVAVIIFVSTFVNVSETLAPKNKRNLEKEFLMDYWHVLKNSSFLGYTFCASAAFGGFLTFFSSSSYIIIGLLKVPQQHFGFYFGAIGIVFFLGSLLSGYSAKHLGTCKTAAIGAFFMSLSGVVMFVWYHLFGLSLSGFMWPMMIMGVGGAFMMGAGAGGAISPFPDMAGTASALFGCFQFVFGFAVSQIALEWPVTSTLTLACTLGGLGLVAFIWVSVSSVVKWLKRS